MVNKRSGAKASNKKKGKKAKRRSFTLGVVISRVIFSVLLVSTILVGIVSLANSGDGNSDAELPDEGLYYEGIVVNGHNLAGLTYKQAWDMIAPEVQSDIDSFRVSIKVGTNTWILTATDIGVTSNLGKILIEANKLGRGKVKAENLAEQEDLRVNGRNYTVELSMDEETVAGIVSSIAAHVNTPAVNATITTNKYVSEPSFKYTEGSNGRILNEATIVADVLDALQNHTGEEIILAPEFEVSLPEVTVDTLREQAKLISVHETYYKSGSASNANRIRNIQKAADILNGAVIQVGEEFSFNEFIGPRYENNGWLLAPGIVNGSRYTQQAGGGICQVSTTLYNSLLKCGPEIEFTERRKHSWPSSYADYGLDATVSTGGPDLKFVNNTASPIYIFAYADNVNYVMTVYIYGTPLPEGVTYDIEGVTTEVIKPDAPLYIDVPTWPEGYQETYVTARDGYRATAYRYKYINGELVETEELYTDYYKAVQGQIKRGTGSTLLPRPS